MKTYRVHITDQYNHTHTYLINAEWYGKAIGEAKVIFSQQYPDREIVRVSYNVRTVA